MSRRYNTLHVTDDKTSYMREYMRNKRKNYQEDKEVIPIEDRCEDFDNLWELIYNQVLYEWDEVENAYVLKNQSVVK